MLNNIAWYINQHFFPHFLLLCLFVCIVASLLGSRCLPTRYGIDLVFAGITFSFIVLMILFMTYEQDNPAPASWFNRVPNLEASYKESLSISRFFVVQRAYLANHRRDAPLAHDSHVFTTN